MASFKIWATIVAILGGLAEPALASPVHNGDAFAVHVRLVLTRARIDASAMAEAKAEVARIYRAAGITIVWTGAGETGTEPVRQIWQRSLIVLIRSDDTPARLLLPESALGMAPSTAHLRGGLAFIFWNRVQKAAIKYLHCHIPVEKVLAIAISHEIGHLLLPEGHSTAGLMKSEWEVRDFVMARRGVLLLSAEEGLRIRDSLADAETGARSTDQ